jgi:uncharacterized protein DUF5906
MWLADPERREYLNGITFEPTDRADGTKLNLWRGFAVSPTWEDTRPMLEFIFYVICAGDLAAYGYVLAWLAQLVQEPHIKPGTALVLIGEHGTGNSTFAEVVRKLFGRHALSVNSASFVTRNFNKHLMDKCVVVIEEGSITRSQAHAMKDIITNDVMLCEPKGVDAIELPNHLRIILCTNDPRPIYAESDARRFCVLPVSPVRRQDHAYFGGLRAWMANGGLSAFLRFLQDYDHSSVELRQVPQTAALTELKIQSLKLVERFVHNALQTGELIEGHPWGEPIGCMTLVHAINETKMRWEPALDASQVGKQLKSMFPDMLIRRTKKPQRSRLYLLPPWHEARLQFVEHFGQQITWEPIEDEIDTQRAPRLVTSGE